MQVFELSLTRLQVRQEAPMLMWHGGTSFSWDGIVSLLCPVPSEATEQEEVWSCSVPPALMEASLELLRVMPLRKQKMCHLQE